MGHINYSRSWTEFHQIMRLRFICPAFYKRKFFISLFNSRYTRSTAASLSHISARVLSGLLMAWNSPSSESSKSHGDTIKGNILVPSSSAFLRIGGNSSFEIKSEGRNAVDTNNIATLALPIAEDITSLHLSPPFIFVSS